MLGSVSAEQTQPTPVWATHRLADGDKVYLCNKCHAQWRVGGPVACQCKDAAIPRLCAQRDRFHDDSNRHLQKMHALARAAMTQLNDGDAMTLLAAVVADRPMPAGFQAWFAAAVKRKAVACEPLTTETPSLGAALAAVGRARPMTLGDDGMLPGGAS